MHSYAQGLGFYSKSTMSQSAKYILEILTNEIVNLKNFGHTMCSLENNLNVLLFGPQ